MKVRSKIRLFFVGILLITFASCSNGEVYFRYHHIERGMWYRDSVLSFTLDSISIKSDFRNDFSIELTTSELYPYKDIWLQVEHNLNDTVYTRDTLHTRLADDYGKWIGSGTGGLHQISLPYKSEITLDTSRIYVLKISHLMKDEPLYGVEKAGIKVMGNMY
ncbi:MAG: gliding motility lipoprotein GldH [Fermentimonas sp.]|nr:gliding motility lipoprotein GldH [Fermentimonas sp.]